MSQAFFDPEKFKVLPLWAQVLCAVRSARRYVLALPADVPADVREELMGACDACERCVRAGSRGGDDGAAMARGARVSGGLSVTRGAEVVRWMADAALAANDAMDFGAAEAACANSAMTAMKLAGTHAKLVGMTPLQFAICGGSDANQLAFVCEEMRVGRYGALVSGVFERLTPVYAPERVLETDLHPMHDDPTGGAR